MKDPSQVLQFLTVYASRYLSEAKINDGKTPHNFRVGLSNTLNMLGCSEDEISLYLGWKSKTMVNRYIKRSETAGSLPLMQRIQSEEVSLDMTPASHPDNLQCIF